jgi:hypothetical protein
VATGTGSGKTEAFLYPILDHCLRLRDAGAADGVVAVLVYPMNALAYDQLERLRDMLAGSGVSFGMYVGSTPRSTGAREKKEGHRGIQAYRVAGHELLHQIVEKWREVLDAAHDALADCTGECETSCYECMRTYRNIFFHEILDRFTAAELIEQWRGKVKFERDVPPREEIQRGEADGHPTNVGEKSLGDMLQQAGYPEFEDQHPIEIALPFGRTTPDLYYEAPTAPPGWPSTWTASARPSTATPTPAARTA